MTSYSGLIVTLALAVSGALLYWIIIAPGQVPIADHNNSYETFGSIEITAPKFTPPTAPPAEPQIASSEEFSAPPDTTAEAAPELIHVPEQLPVPTDEAPPMFDDASAQVYPTTGYQQEWNLAGLSETDLTAEKETSLSSKSEVTELELPPTPIRVSRQQ